ncbi:hypothetical protein H0G86_006275 [Trichoderma simmonsii]|uniref:Uncharacterized protein n=1 Tax=Trichoderma simmonsii TaxID=1491479 RepID=A0A8G0LB57_9HYPO|nr:hypothetical protein H0G86_006275 [Trichoderma simmonsii]
MWTWMRWEREYGVIFLCVYRSWRMENHPLPCQEKTEALGERSPKSADVLPSFMSKGHELAIWLRCESNIPGDEKKEQQRRNQFKNISTSSTSSLIPIQSTYCTVSSHLVSRSGLPHHILLSLSRVAAPCIVIRCTTKTDTSKWARTNRPLCQLGPLFSRTMTSSS